MRAIEELGRIPPPMPPLRHTPPPPGIIVLDEHTHALRLLLRLREKSRREGRPESARRYDMAARLVSAIDLPPNDPHTLPGVGEKERGFR